MSESAMQTIDDLRTLLKARGLERLIPHVEKLVAPSIRLILDNYSSSGPEAGIYPNDDTPIGCSKVGGLPDLPPDFEWPEIEDCAIPFLAQFRLDEVNAYDLNKDLPESGLLTFFFDDYDYDFPEECCRVFHLKNVENLERRLFPDNTSRLDIPTSELYPDLDLPFQPAMPAVFWNELNVADDDAIEFEQVSQALQLSADEREIWWQLSLDWSSQNAKTAYHEVVNRRLYDLSQPHHQLLGLPYCGNFDGRTVITGENWQTEASQWRLLFQLSSDDNLNWGDAGKISFFIRHDDLQNCNFEEIRVSCDN